MITTNEIRVLLNIMEYNRVERTISPPIPINSVKPFVQLATIQF